MEPKDLKGENIIFKSNEDILERYGDIFDKETIGEENYYIEKENDLEKTDPFRFFITPNGLIALSSSTGIPGDERDVWDLDFEDEIIRRFLEFLDAFISEKKSYNEFRDLQGLIPYSNGYSYRIYRYNNHRDSEIVKYVLDEKRMGYILSQYTQK
jgi:hypothetical protein